jgi:elongator complex protein 2
VKKISSNNPYHKRIIWTCNFSHDDKYFLTGARDQQVHLWRVADEHEQPFETNILKLNDAVTAVAFADRLIDNDKSDRPSNATMRERTCLFRSCRYLAVIGLDNGHVLFYAWNEQVSWQHLTSMTPP